MAESSSIIRTALRRRPLLPNEAVFRREIPRFSFKRLRKGSVKNENKNKQNNNASRTKFSASSSYRANNSKATSMPQWEFGVRTRGNFPCRILDLPAEVLTKILLYLDHEQLHRRCRLVCKRFNELIADDSFCREKLLEHFGPDVYAKLVEFNVPPSEARRLFTVNLYQGMLRWGHVHKPFVHRVKRNHQCSESSRSAFRSALSLSPVPVMPWMNEPPCYCVFGRTVPTSKLRFHSEVFGWCMIDLVASGIPAQILDVVRPPIAVGMWDPHPEARPGVGPGLQARLANAENKTLVVCECFTEWAANGKPAFFQQIIFKDYPVGVRYLIFYGPNSFLVSINGQQGFCGATVKLLTNSVYAKFISAVNKT